MTLDDMIQKIELMENTSTECREEDNPLKWHTFLKSLFKWDDTLLTMTQSTNICNVIDTLYSWDYWNKDFFKTAASTKYHGSYVGGLVEHCVRVMYYLLRMKREFSEALNNFDVYEICSTALLHDLCKLGYYEQVQDKYKKDKMIWVKCANADRGLGHGVESMVRVQRLYAQLKIPCLKDECLEAIRWHMGAFDLSKTDDAYYHTAVKENPLVLALHYADSLATFWDGK